MKSRLFVVLSICFCLVINACQKENTDTKEQENDRTEISVTGHAESITPLGATLVCYANLESNIPVGTTIGVAYSTETTPTFETAQVRMATTIDANNQYEIEVSGLNPATKYFFRSFVKQNDIIRYGKVKDFTTTSKKIVETLKAEKVSSISAVIPIKVNLSGIKVQSRVSGVCYSSTNQTPSISQDMVVNSIEDKDSLSLSLTSLSPNTTYHYRAYAEINGSLIYGDCLSIITGMDKIATTNEPDSINHISAIVSGKIDLTDCAYTTKEFGVCYGQNENIDINSDKILGDDLTDGLFKVTLPNLMPENVFYYRAFVVIDNVPHYGAVLNFKTPALFKKVSSNEISSVSAMITTVYNIGSIDYSNPVFGVCYGTKSDLSVSDATATGVIVNDTTKISLSGLNQSTEYFVRPFSKINGSIFYGETINFTTLGLVKTIQANKISGVSAHVQVEYDLTNISQKETAFGVCYGESSSTDKKVTGSLSEEKIDVLISALKSSTKYYYRGYVKIGDKEYFGSTQTFTTKQLITESSASNISPISATIDVTVDTLNTYIKQSEFGVCYSTSKNPTTSSSCVKGVLEKDGYSLNISALKPATSYYYRGYAIIDGVTHYGTSKQLTTGEARFATTGDVSNITYCSATIGAKFNMANSIYSSIKYGVCYSKNSTPTISDNTVSGVPDNFGNISINVTNLECSTEYYYRAFVTVDGASYYGNQSKFETAWDPYVVAEIEAGRLVDLGLSVHWASCNVDASSPEEMGNPYAWGETTTKETFTWTNYKYCSGVYNSRPSISKYLDGQTPLSLDDDAARARLGGTYRMPTAKEYDELIEQCTWTWTEKNGIYGYAITGPSGKSIYLPLQKIMVNTILLWHGYYWTKTPYDQNVGQNGTWFAKCLLMTGTLTYPNSGSPEPYYHERYDGFFIRAVSDY